MDAEILQYGKVEGTAFERLVHFFEQIGRGKMMTTQIRLLLEKHFDKDLHGEPSQL